MPRVLPALVVTFAATRLHLKRVWALSLPYFRSSEKGKALGLLAAIVILNLGTVYVLVLLNEWNRGFYDALQNKDQPVFWRELGRFCWYAGIFIAVAVYKFYLTQLLEMRWRQWMTGAYLTRWLAGHAFYHLELKQFQENDPKNTETIANNLYKTSREGGVASVDSPITTPDNTLKNTPDTTNDATPDNPDQRIQEDINQFTSATISLAMGLMNAVVTLASFVGILWALSGNFAFDVGGTHLDIPGFMVWMALLYCVLGSAVTHWIGRPLVRLNFMQQRLEADFRHHLVRVREYSETIALDKGAPVEHGLLAHRFAAVLANNWRLIRTQKNLLWFTTGFGQIASVFPLIVAAPRYFSTEMKLGELMQVALAFGRVQDSLAWFIDNYDRLATWSATASRLTSFEASFVALEARATSGVLGDGSGDESRGASAQFTRQPQTSSGAAAGLVAEGLRFTVGGGRELFQAPHLSLNAGDRVLLSGASGSGKSTLFRAIAGIWPGVTGTVSLPAGFDDDAMFLPQRPYFPQGRLRDALAYPEPAAHYGDSDLQAALLAALLPDLADRLDESAAWNLRLSGGEQQRLAMARVLLKKPRWLFADEATSALDEATEATLYTRLLETVAARDGAIVSIAHRASVKAFHTRQWVMQDVTHEGATQRRLVELG